MVPGAEPSKGHLDTSHRPQQQRAGILYASRSGWGVLTESIACTSKVAESETYCEVPSHPLPDSQASKKAFATTMSELVVVVVVPLCVSVRVRATLCQSLIEGRARKFTRGVNLYQPSKANAPRSLRWWWWWSRALRWSWSVRARGAARSTCQSLVRRTNARGSTRPQARCQSPVAQLWICPSDPRRG